MDLTDDIPEITAWPGVFAPAGGDRQRWFRKRIENERRDMPVQESAQDVAKQIMRIRYIRNAVCGIAGALLLSGLIPEERKFAAADKIASAFQAGDNSFLPDPDTGLPENMEEVHRKIASDVIESAKKLAFKLAEKKGYKDIQPNDPRMDALFIGAVRIKLGESELPVNTRYEITTLVKWQLEVARGNLQTPEKPARIISGFGRQ